MSSDEETQHPPTPPPTPHRPRTWMRWLAPTRQSRVERTPATTSPEPLNIHATLRALPTLLDTSSLPNGIVELLVEDCEAPTRQLFDIHDGHITLVEPGKCVPWACIAGSPTAWALALGPTRDTAALQLTGDERLARRVLAALPREG